METTFKYKGQTISTPNLEKKLKRMKISINDIEIIKEEKKLEEEKLPELLDTYRKIRIRSTLDDSTRIGYIPKDSPNPEIKDLLKRFMWNPTTKTGLKELTEDYVKTLYYEK